MVKTNDPLTIGIALIIIVGVILYINSMTVSNVVSQPVNTIKAQLVNSNTNASEIVNESSLYPLAPELVGIDGYINTGSNLTLASLRGKVVLLDFWTYSCINCIRTLPYLEAWNQKYASQGLVIIGVQSPEFDFEKNYSNVLAAVQKYNITYPVVLDNEHDTWNAYSNLYWPEDYLIDANGYIRYQDIGEGNYDTTEGQIQQLLMERNQQAQLGSIVADNVTTTVANNMSTSYNLGMVGTPEIYVGYQFARQNIGNAEGFQQDTVVNYSTPFQIQPNVVYFQGSWLNNPDNMELNSSTGKIFLNYNAKDVNIVAGGNGTLDILLNNETPMQNELGSDSQLINGSAQTTVNSERLYNLVDDTGYNQKTIEIDVTGPGFRLYTFTFG